MKIMDLLKLSKPHEILQAFAGSILGTVVAGVGATQENTWAVITGSAIGAGSVAWVFGLWLRDRTLQYLRKQNDELWEALKELKDQQSIDSAHLDKQDVDADKRAADAMGDRARLRENTLSVDECEP
jgi:hypothetical protein